MIYVEQGVQTISSVFDVYFTMQKNLDTILGVVCLKEIEKWMTKLYYCVEDSMRNAAV